MSSEAENQPEDPALWRFGVISPLLHLHHEGPSLAAELERLAGQSFTGPDGRRVSISADTLRHWLYLYRRDGLAGLAAKVRKDKGATSLPPAFQGTLRSLREQHPAWTIQRILEYMANTGEWNGRVPSRSAIYRFAVHYGLGRNPVQPSSAVRSFEYAHFGELWISDFLHGPKVRLGRQEKKSYLHAIIDDATRYIVAAQFHLAEDTRALINDLSLAVRRFGVCLRYYTDNGSAFRSAHLVRTAARLRIALPHTPPYHPRGRGKIERFFRSLRDGFLTGRPKTSLDTLNCDLRTWIGSYHARIHSALGMSPLNKRLHTPSVAKPLDGVKDFDALFRMEAHKTVYSDGCIRLQGYRYEALNALPGQKIKVSWVPWDLSVIYLGPDNTPTKPLDKIQNARRFQNPRRKRKDNQ